MKQNISKVINDEKTKFLNIRCVDAFTHVLAYITYNKLTY